MFRKNMSIEMVDEKINSAGKSFLAFRMEDLLRRIGELDNRTLKKELIEEYYNNQIGAYDSDNSGTTTRVNAAIRIIKADKVLYALKKIAYSAKTNSTAIARAKQVIRKIECGELTLPHLD